MKVTIFGFLALLSVGLSVAAPSPGKNDPPGAPSKSLGSVSQSCSASQSSIHCCNSEGSGSKGPGPKDKSVYWSSGSGSLTCDQITESDNSKNVQSICSTTVACCVGDGCIAIAN